MGLRAGYAGPSSSSSSMDDTVGELAAMKLYGERVHSGSIHEALVSTTHMNLANDSPRASQDQEREQPLLAPLLANNPTTLSCQSE